MVNQLGAGFHVVRRAMIFYKAQLHLRDYLNQRLQSHRTPLYPTGEFNVQKTNSVHNIL